MEHKAFIVYQSHAKLVRKLSVEEAGQLFLAIIEYNETGTCPDLSVAAGIIFEIMRQDFDRDREKYEKRCAINAANGAKASEYGRTGGRPKKNPEKTAQGSEENPVDSLGIQKTPIGFSGNPKKPQSGFHETPKTPKDKDKDKDIFLIDTKVSIADADVSDVAEVGEPPKEYGNQDINKMLGFLRQSVGCDDFKESQAIQRRYAKHFLSLGKKLGQEEFLSRLKAILADSFKSRNCHKIGYLYGELKAYIHSPVIENEPTKVSPNVF